MYSATWVACATMRPTAASSGFVVGRLVQQAFRSAVGCNRWMSFGHLLGPTGFEPPALTLSTQPLR